MKQECSHCFCHYTSIFHHMFNSNWKNNVNVARSRDVGVLQLKTSNFNLIAFKPKANFQIISIFFVSKQMYIWRFQQFYFSKVPLVSVKCTQLCRLMGSFFPFLFKLTVGFLSDSTPGFLDILNNISATSISRNRWIGLDYISWNLHALSIFPKSTSFKSPKT